MSRPRKPGITGGMLSVEPKICEHGNTFNCLPCEVKNLNYVIQELIEQNEQLKHRIPREIEDDLRRKLTANEKTIDVIEQIATGKIKHINHHARLLHILEVIDVLKNFSTPYEHIAKFSQELHKRKVIK